MGVIDNAVQWATDIANDDRDGDRIMIVLLLL